MFLEFLGARRVSRLKRLLENKDFIGAFDYYKGLADKGLLSEENIKFYKPIVYQHYLTALYSACSDTLGTKSFDLFFQILKGIRVLVMTEPEVFELNKSEMDDFLKKVTEDLRNHHAIRLEDMRSFSDKYAKMCEEAFQNKKAASAMSILVDTFLLESAVGKLKNE